MPNRFTLAVFAAAVVILASSAASPLNAQVLYGSIVGAVEDQTGAVVQGATVAITAKATGRSARPRPVTRVCTR
jgi:hypothetical protein